MKRIFIFLIAVALVLCLRPYSYAGETVSDMISGEQDILLLASVEDITDNVIILDPYDVIGTSDNTLPERIAVDKFRYSYCEDHSDISFTPVKGNNIFISLNKNGARYTVVHGAYKVSSLDYRLLTFYASESMRDKECLAELVALANFVRSDGATKDFVFADGVLTAKVGNRSIALYPTSDITESISFVNDKGEIVDAPKTKDVIIEGESVHLPNDDDIRWIVSLVIIILGAVSGAVVVYNSAAADSKKAIRKDKVAK